MYIWVSLLTFWTFGISWQPLNLIFYQNSKSCLNLASDSNIYPNQVQCSLWSKPNSQIVGINTAWWHRNIKSKHVFFPAFDQQRTFYNRRTLSYTLTYVLHHPRDNIMWNLPFFYMILSLDISTRCQIDSPLNSKEKLIRKNNLPGLIQNSQDPLLQG